MTRKIWLVNLIYFGIYPVNARTGTDAINKAIQYLINNEPRCNVKALRKDQREGKFNAVEREVIE